MLDAAGRVAVVNPALREMLLLGPQAVGKSPLELIRHAELKDLLDEARRTGGSSAREIELSGLKPRQLLVRAAPIAGESRAIFAVFVDVTEMRRLESMRREFVANVSHELRTPVTAIRSAAETLKSVPEKDIESRSAFMEMIDRNAERLQELIEDLLDLSRIESRGIRLSFEPLDLRSVFAHVVSLFEERAAKKHIRLTIDVPGELPPVESDRRALEHILTNLVDNAVKYCKSDADITLRARQQGDGVWLQVQDTGPGIAPRHLPRLFERFYRVDAGRSRELGGTGLGLSIVKHLAEALDTTVSVESTVGEGTAFSLVLPPPGVSSRNCHKGVST
jgi:two-component system, OmpR family, phosphate regulon sensor histidine kinase PhoR